MSSEVRERQPPEPDGAATSRTATLAVDAGQTGTRAAVVRGIETGPLGRGPGAFIRRLRRELTVPVLADVAERLDCPVVAEGRYTTPGQVRAWFAAGAFAVVVGTAITEPVTLTRRFAAAAPATLAVAPGPGGGA